MASDGHHFDYTGRGSSGAATPLRSDSARLMPGSGIQFVDFEIPTGPLALNFGRYVEDLDQDQGPVLIPLHARLDTDDIDWHPVTNRSLAPDEALWLTGYNGIEPFLDVWVPLPYLRVLGGQTVDGAGFDSGPANWARLFIARPAADLRDAQSLRAVIAFDTSLDARGRLDQEHYLAPNVDDVRLASEFRLAADPAVVSPLLAESWIDGWLAQCFAAHRIRLEGGAAARADGPPNRFRLEHAARYLSLLRVLEQTGALPAVRFADIFADGIRNGMLDTDLAIDIGDDRTAAILIAQRAGHDEPNLAEAETLRLRDLSCPTQVHTGAFRTLGEFDRPNFGDVAASRLSGRADAFYWPSLLRVGEEASRLSMRPSAVPGLTGLGNLRSALSEAPVRNAVWRFSRDDLLGGEPGPVVAGEVLSHVTEDGAVISPGDGAAVPALRPRFSHASILSMFIAEIVLHALGQINAPDTLASGGPVRRLRRVIVTCPVAASEAERHQLQACVESGISLVWKASGWPDASTARSPGKPQVQLGLDPGLSAQLVYLFDEIQGRFGGNARQFVGLTRGADSTTAGVGSLTVASLDVAGGATSLAIVDYDLGRENAAHPQIVLADRCAIGGASLSDCILAEVVVPAIAEALASSGHGGSVDLIERLLASSSGTAKASAGNGDRYLGERLLHRIARPAATAFLDLYRELPLGVSAHGSRQFSLQALVARGGGRMAPVDAHIEALAEAGGARNFRLAEVRIGLQPRAVARIIEHHLDPLLTLASGVIRHYACDLLLLTGPYAGLDDFRRLLLKRLPLAPHRVVTVGERRIGLPGSADGANPARSDMRLLPLVGACLASSHALENSGLALITDGLNNLARATRSAGLGALGRPPLAIARIARPADGPAPVSGPEAAPPALAALSAPGGA